MAKMTKDLIIAHNTVRVYVSGPYTKGDPCENTHNMIKAANQLLDAGIAPFVPLLSHFWHTVTPRPYEDWMRIDLAYIPLCDAILRIPGESSGAEREIAVAKECRIPVFYDIPALLEWLHHDSPFVKLVTGNAVVTK